MSSPTSGTGRLLKAPENFLDRHGVRQVFEEARHGRRDFIRQAFAGAAGAAEFLRHRGEPVAPVRGLAATRALTRGRIEWIEGTHLFPMEQPIATAAAIEAALLNLHHVWQLKTHH